MGRSGGRLRNLITDIPGVRVGHAGDGRLGSGTRAAVKQAQLKLGLPADSYPTPELLARLRGGR